MWAKSPIFAWQSPYTYKYIKIYIYVCIYPQYISVEQLLNPQLARSPTIKKFRSDEDMARELRVQGYSSQRRAHVAAFGPVNLTLEAAHDMRTV